GRIEVRAHPLPFTPLREQPQSGAFRRTPSDADFATGESMRGEKMRSAVRTDLRRHHALGARAKSYQNGLARPPVGDAVAPERLHVDEDIRRAFAEREKTESGQPVEPLYDGALEPACWDHRHMGPRRRHLRRMDRGRLIHGEHTEGLQTLRPLHGLD